jgi:ABC-type Fe3+ transport system substrate-binding protein
MDEQSYWARSLRAAHSRRSVLRVAAVAGAGFIGAAALACKPAGSNTGSSSASGATPQTAAQPSGDAAFQQQWNDLITQAKGEKELIAVLGPDTVDAEGKIYQRFGDLYGVKVTTVGGNSTDVTNRILAERSQGLYTVDILGLGGGGTIRMLQANTFGPLAQWFIVPDVVDRSKGWRVNYVPWSVDDKDQNRVTFYGLGVNLNLIQIYYNTKNVTKQDLDSLQSWNDFLKPRWKGKIAIGDISNDEAEGNLTTAWLYLGKGYLEQLLAQKPTVIAYGDARSYSDGLARGQFDIGLFSGASEQALVTARGQGLPIDELPVQLKEGSVAEITRNIGVIDKPAHPNATKLFVNWYLSKPGQTVYQELNTRPNLVSLRSDVPQGKVPDALWKRATDPSLKIVDDNSEPYRTAKAQSQAWTKTAFQQYGLRP